MEASSQRLTAFYYTYFLAARGGGRGGFQQRDAGPPDTVLGTFRHLFDFALLIHL